MQNQPSSADRPFKRLGRSAIRVGHALRAADDALFSWLCRASETGPERGLARFSLAVALLSIAMIGVTIGVASLSPDVGRHRGRIVGFSTAGRAPRLDDRCAQGVSPDAHVVVVDFADGDHPRSFKAPDGPRWAIGDDVVATSDGCVIERARLLDR